MDKIRLSNKDIAYLLDWRDEHKDLVRRADCPMKAVKVDLYEAGWLLTGIRDGRDLKLTVNTRGRSFGAIKFRQMLDGTWDLYSNKTKLDHDGIQSVLTVYASSMAFIVYGSETHELAAEESAEEQDIAPEKDTKSKSGSKKNVKKSSSGVTYILHQRTHKSGSKGHHRPISCEFSVRGHFRHYKSGKTVWIAEYRKGTGDKKDKVYMVGA
jgi:hypothetical protein